jgi:hypothetical protein
MKTKKVDSRFSSALEAIGKLLLPELNATLSGGWTSALFANSEINMRPISLKAEPFHRHLIPLLQGLSSLLARAYRRYFKLGLAHPQQCGTDPHEWALGQINPAISVTLEWLRNWYMLACDGSNQYVQPIASIACQPGQAVSIPVTCPEIPSIESWRAPAWLFAVGPIVGIGLLKKAHVPSTESDDKLGAAHTRLLLKGARRVFLWKLRSEIEIVHNQEVALFGTLPAEAANRPTRRYNKRTGWQQRLKLYEVVRKILVDPNIQGIEFCAELDKRHAQPLFDWTKTDEWRKGLTWKEAWKVPSLKRKIRRVRQEAMKNG